MGSWEMASCSVKRLASRGFSFQKPNHIVQHPLSFFLWSKKGKKKNPTAYSHKFSSLHQVRKTGSAFFPQSDVYLVPDGLLHQAVPPERQSDLGSVGTESVETSWHVAGHVLYVTLKHPLNASICFCVCCKTVLLCLFCALDDVKIPQV